MLNIWTVNSGASLGTIEERTGINLTLPTSGDLTGVTFSRIAGTLPPGLRIENNKIVGSAFEVSKSTVFTFVLRAKKNGDISDRTLSITVEGADAPEWITPEGDLLVNPNGLAFVLDNTFIDFQLSAIDRDMPAGENLEYFIQEGDGSLPPGLTLASDGKITGFIDPILALDISAGTGFFDTNLFDSNPFDFGLRPNTGYETFLYDSLTYDYFDILKTPRKLNRNYEFIVSVTDGTEIIKRKFKIFVVGDDFLRADNTIIKVGTGVFTADNTYLRSAIWLSASNLGIKRANNYVTVFLDAFDPNPDTGPLVYELASINDDLSPSALPPGLFLDSNNGELFGFIPYQPAVTREYKFTVNAIKYDKEAVTEIEIAVVVFENSALGQNFLKIEPLPPGDGDRLVLENIRIGNYNYRVTEYQDVSITGNDYEILRLDTNLKLDVPIGTIITTTFLESTLEFNTSRAAKTFVLQVLGEVDSVIRFITPQNLGSIRANFSSTLYVEAETSVPNARLTYTLVGGALPPGLELSSTGELIGKVKQYGTIDSKGLTIFDTGNTTFDGAKTTFDRSYTFRVLAKDQFQYSAILGEFTVSVEDPDEILFSNVYVKPFPKQVKRDLFYNFINDTSIFTPSKIYRPSDPEFGVQYDLKMLLYAGIETSQIINYVAALTKNTKRKRFKLGNPKKAIARAQGSADTMYEIVYLEVFDEYEIGNKSVDSVIKLNKDIQSPTLINQARIDPVNGLPSTIDNLLKANEEKVDRFRLGRTPLTADLSAVKISGSDLEYIYPSSVSNIRTNIRNITVSEDGSTQRQLETENAFLPLWMLTPQDARTAATGFIKAIPLCYCKPNEADYIIDNIGNSGFDFTNLDYEIDRFIIDSTIGNSNEQYLKFKNYKFNV